MLESMLFNVKSLINSDEEEKVGEAKLHALLTTVSIQIQAKTEFIRVDRKDKNFIKQFY